MTRGQYILVGQTPVPCPDLLEWAIWFEEREHRIVRMTQVGEWFVSTIFLGLDHNWGKGPPLLFETMAWEQVEPYRTALGIEVSRKFRDDIQERCATWMEAEAQHERVVEQLRQAEDGTWRAVCQLEPAPLPEMEARKAE